MLETTTTMIKMMMIMMMMMIKMMMIMMMMMIKMMMIMECYRGLSIAIYSPFGSFIRPKRKKKVEDASTDT